MVFSKEDRILMRNLCVSKVVEQKKLAKQFLNKRWRMWRLNKLLKKLQETVTMTGRSVHNISCFSIL